jgi:choline dehydrogenase-like flavoprotein
MTSDETHYDAIVVGTGPGGATIARELARAGQRVLILEWGEQRPVTGSLGQALRELFMPGKSFLLSYGLMGVARGITVGGSSLYYCGTAFEPPYEMLERHGIDIRDDVAEARAELPIAPLSAELIGPKARRVMESARAVGLDWKPLEKFFYQDRCPSWEAMGFYCAPTYEAKWNARMWVDEAVACGAVLQTRANVRKVLVEGKTATGVVYEAGGSTQRARADTIIVAAGGIGSPTILRASGIRGTGRDFFFDPLIFAMGTVDGLDGPPEIPMSAGVHCADDGYMMTDFSVAKSFHIALAAQAGKLRRLGAHARTAGIMVKAKDSLGGHLTDRGGVRKRLAPEDAAKLQHGYERAQSILAEAGARDVSRTLTVAAHPGGTIKVGELLDANLQTEFANLYVCDCSVIPEAWGLPPTLTLIGFGKRLARHLLGAASASGATEIASAAAGG